MSTRLLLASLLTLSLLAACGRVDSTPTPTSLSSKPTATVVAPTPTHQAAPFVLRVWVTPRFDPQTNALLHSRLEDFVEAHSNLRIEVRLKDEVHLLEALRLTSLAAPGASPDLIALPRAELESASEQGLLQSLDASLLDEVDWYPSARALGRVRESVYGLPFALDALALVSSGDQAVTTWQEVANGGPLAFNVNEARFPLALYLSAGGELTDAQGRPALDEVALARVLSLFAQGEVFAFESDEAVWSMPAQDGFAVSWVAGRLNGNPPNVRFDALPGLGDPSATLVTGWAWAVATADVEKKPLAVELAAWLTADEFLDEWIPSIEFLPPRPDARWDDLLQEARLVPPAALAAIIEPVLREAVANVLMGMSPEAAARMAMERLK